MCDIVFVSATVLNVQIFPTFCEQYIIRIRDSSLNTTAHSNDNKKSIKNCENPGTR